VLVVSDSSLSASSIAAQLQQMGSVVRVFADARPALVAVVADAPPVDRVRALPGVVEVRPTAPFLSTLDAGPARTVDVGGVVFGGAGVPVIAGPCSVDDDARLARLAHAVRGAGAALLRAGVTKVRTNPYGWNGPGPSALRTLRDVGRQAGLPVVSEVLREADVDAFAESVDLLQVGARNMQNVPLLQLLGRTRRPVLLKRAFGCTVDELLGAADHILAAGNDAVILCERGIRTFEGGVRFSFDLSALALLKVRTRLPVVVDPSHAAGDHRLVAAIARGAIAAGADGLIVEVHDDRARARSDREQALSLDAFATLVDETRKVAAAVGRNLHGPAPEQP
jgi:3-deoxy-7-phosphoheptulonate synthase